MKEFFREWRRKTGLVTLVMACVAMVGWVRSLTQEDIFSLNVFPQRIAADSTLGNIHLFRFENYVQWTQAGGSPFPRFQWENLPSANPEPFVAVVIRGAVSGSLNNFGRDAVSPTIITCVIPYWSVVIPLMLLSAYLLLSMHRKSPSKETIKPTGNEGA